MNIFNDRDISITKLFIEYALNGQYRKYFNKYYITYCISVARIFSNFTKDKAIIIFTL